MVRGLISFAVVSVAVVVQLTIVDRIAFPGGTGPDVVLLAVAALGLAGGPLTGVLVGFWAGLALDVAPPGSHFVGQNALVFCLVGYLCGLAADVPNSEGVPEQGHTALFEIAVTAIGAVLGEVLGSLLGAMLSDPRVTWPAIRYVLPVAVIYDLLLCPFVLYAVAAALRLAGAPRSQRDRAAWTTPAVRNPASATQGAIRQVNGGNTPRLRLAERGKGDGVAGGLRGQGTASRVPARRETRLKLGHGGPLGASTLGAAFATGGSRRGSRLSSGTMAGALGGGAAKVKFSARRGEGMLGGALGGFGGTSRAGLGGANRALNSNLARSRLTSSRFGRSRMGRSLLGGSVFSHSPSALRASAPPKRPAQIGRSSFLGRSPALGRPASVGRPSTPGRSLIPRRTVGRMRSSPGGSATGYPPRGSRPGLLARLTGAMRRSAPRQPRLRMRQATFRQPIRPRSPGRGWLRRSPLRRTTLGGGKLGGGTMGHSRAPRLGAGPTRLHMPRPRGLRARKRWRTGGYR
jgi:rod shape-determining protein MreD